MTAKEKAFDLFKKMRHNRWVSKEGAIECAMTCVNEMIKETSENGAYKGRIVYLDRVKQEIKKL